MQDRGILKRTIDNLIETNQRETKDQMARAGETLSFRSIDLPNYLESETSHTPHKVKLNEFENTAPILLWFWLEIPYFGLRVGLGH